MFGENEKPLEYINLWLVALIAIVMCIVLGQLPYGFIRRVVDVIVFAKPTEVCSCASI